MSVSHARPVSCRGLTVIEMAVVVALIAVVVAVAIPVIATSRGQQDQTVALVTLRAVETRLHELAGPTGPLPADGELAGLLSGAHLTVTSAPAVSDDPAVVSMLRLSDTQAVMTVGAAGGMCWALLFAAGAPARWAADTSEPHVAACDAGVVDPSSVTGRRDAPSQLH